MFPSENSLRRFTALRQIFLRYLLLSCYAWYPWLQTDESGAIELKTGGVRHVYQLLYTDSYGNCRPRRKKQRRSWKNYILIWSSRISDAPALKCIVNRWAESVVMVKPVPVFYLANKTSICVVWELLSENFIVVIEVIITRGTFGPPWTPPRPMSNLSERSAKTPVSIHTVGMIIHNRKKRYYFIITSITTQAS